MNPNRRGLTSLTLLLVPGLGAPAAGATILDDFDAGTIITDFTFDDPIGTMIPDTANSGTLGGSFDTDGDTDDVVTNGAGQLDASGKANTAFGSHYVDLPTISAGRVIALFDVTWDFDESVYDDSQEEEFRMTLVSNDPRSTFVTAEILYERTSATEVTLLGNGTGTGAADTPDVVFDSSESVLAMIDLDIESRVFDLLYSTDGGTSFILAGSGLTGDFDSVTPEIDVRPISSVRLVLNEDFSDDAFVVDRFALSFVPEPSSLLLLLASGLAAAATRR